MKRFVLRSTLPGLDEIGEAVLRKGGSALRAVLSSFFVAAGERSGVLFGPVSLLVAGLGSGARVYDGRARQPGLGAKRPRGFTDTETIPAAARVAIPGTLGALALACAYDQGTSLLSCVRPGVAAATRSGSGQRADMLELVASHGGATLSQAAVQRAWLGQFGPTAGGNSAVADLVPATNIDGSAASDAELSGLPWGQDEGDSAPGLGSGHALIAVDAQGQLVALAFRELPDDLLFEPYGMAVPLLAEPVRRGVSRYAPGSILPTPAALEVERDAGGALVRVTAYPRGRDGGSLIQLGRDPRTKSVG